MVFMTVHLPPIRACSAETIQLSPHSTRVVRHTDRWELLEKVPATVLVGAAQKAGMPHQRGAEDQRDEAQAIIYVF